MSIRPRLSHEESRDLALQAARDLLIEDGPQAVTLKAVAKRVGRTHSNLLHHFGSASGLQRALAEYLARRVCAAIAVSLGKRKEGTGSAREIVDLAFDAFGREGGGALASWMLATGNEDALDTVFRAIHDLVDTSEENLESPAMARDRTLALVLMALGDALMGDALSRTLGLPPGRSRHIAESMLIGDPAEAGTSTGD